MNLFTVELTKEKNQTNQNLNKLAIVYQTDQKNVCLCCPVST